jgi:hypothetical protein
VEDEARWYERLAELVDFRLEGNDWPRHHDYESEREHTLGVWTHAQRCKRRRGELDPLKVKLLGRCSSRWQTGGPVAALPGGDRKVASSGQGGPAR